jgi:hypothetical protein
MPRAAIARSRAPTVFSVRMKSVSVQKTRLWIKATRFGVAFIQDRRLRTDALFIRAQSTIRADGFSSAQHHKPETAQSAILATT